MKKQMIMVMIVVMLALPAALFAGDGISIGATAMYPTGMTLEGLAESTATPEISSEDLWYGLASRLDMSLLQVDATAYYLEIETVPTVIGTLNAGLYLDLGIVGFGTSGGVIYGAVADAGGLLGYDVKANVDLMLGPAILSTYVVGLTTQDIDQIDGPEDFEAGVGVSALIQL